MQATLTHNGINKSITVPILEENGTPLFSVDVGKPELDYYEHGELNPRFNDRRSGILNYVITTQLVGPNAYDNARLLCDIIKSRQGPSGSLTLSVSGSNLPSIYPTSNVLVSPGAQQEEALSVTYSAGRKDVVDVELTLTRVNQVRGGANQEATTPTATGTGPIVLTNGTTSVELIEDIAVTRSVGRPNSPIRSGVDRYPNYIDHRKTAYDAFELQFQFYNNAQAKVVDLADALIQPQLGTQSLTLDFQGLFGLGSFNVVPDGSQALRVQRNAGQKGIENIPTVALRRVI